VVAESPTRRERQRAERRQRLIEAALASFGQLGYAHTSVRDITEGADLGHGTFYLYFKSKDDLFLWLVGESVAALRGQLVAPAPADEDVLPSLRRSALGVLAWFGEHRGVLLALREALILDAAFWQAWEPAQAMLEEWLGEIVAWGERRGVYRGRDRARTISLTISLLLGAASEATLMLRQGQEAEPDPAGLAEDVAHYCRNALFRLP
jgi:AcrR family transcriptional regulator